MTIRARLFDAEGEDQEVEAGPDAVPAKGADRLLWVDVDARSSDDLARIGALLDFSPSLVTRLDDDPKRASLTQYPEHVHLSLATMEPRPIGEPGVRIAAS